MKIKQTNKCLKKTPSQLWLKLEVDCAHSTIQNWWWVRRSFACGFSVTKLISRCFFITTVELSKWRSSFSCWPAATGPVERLITLHSTETRPLTRTYILALPLFGENCNVEEANVWNSCQKWSLIITNNSTYYTTYNFTTFYDSYEILRFIKWI